ncbi:MAG: hypothetical protein RJA22_2523 [Verrucomicrobiota bacterium]
MTFQLEPTRMKTSLCPTPRLLRRAAAGLVAAALAGAPGLHAAEAKPVYENTFESAALDKVPDDMLVLDGGFAVKEEAGNKFIELPGAPLETFGILLGPSEASGLSIQARVMGTGKGRRFPTFAVGLNGVGGHRLQVSPAKKLIELYKGDEVVTNAPLAWTSGSWTLLRLQSRKVKEGEYRIEGRAWKQGDPEPKDWPISVVETAETPAGRPSIWGNPYAGTAIRYDDLRVTRTE